MSLPFPIRLSLYLHITYFYSLAIVTFIPCKFNSVIIFKSNKPKFKLLPDLITKIIYYIYSIFILLFLIHRLIQTCTNNFNYTIHIHTLYSYTILYYIIFIIYYNTYPVLQLYLISYSYSSLIIYN